MRLDEMLPTIVMMYIVQLVLMMEWMVRMIVGVAIVVVANQWRRLVHFKVLLLGQDGIVVIVLVHLVDKQHMRLVCVITYKFCESRIITCAGLS